MAANVVDEAFASGKRQIEMIIRQFDELHHEQFSRRLRISALLRSLTFRPATRSALVTIFSRSQSLMKLAARGTRQQGLRATEIS